MKLDKRHLIGSVFLLGGSVVYNVWIFTRPAGGSVKRTEPSSVETSLLPSTDEALPPAADTTQLSTPPDPVLDRLPEWRRNPFVDRRREPVPVVERAAAQPPPPTSAADPLPTSILYSPSRRLAIIDGRIVGVGDTVQGSRVVEILPNALVLESPARGRRRLEMRPPDTTAPSREAMRR